MKNQFIELTANEIHNVYGGGIVRYMGGAIGVVLVGWAAIHLSEEALILIMAYHYTPLFREMCSPGRRCE